ncbi:MAG: hypothetical protein IJP93_09270 [Bacteroidales bacterium]|nr:hypothetical protein [Bacteroidales bacterium]
MSLFLTCSIKTLDERAYTLIAHFGDESSISYDRALKVGLEHTRLADRVKLITPKQDGFVFIEGTELFSFQFNFKRCVLYSSFPFYEFGSRNKYGTVLGLIKEWSSDDSFFRCFGCCDERLDRSRFFERMFDTGYNSFYAHYVHPYLALNRDFIDFPPMENEKTLWREYSNSPIEIQDSTQKEKRVFLTNWLNDATWREITKTY